MLEIVYCEYNRANSDYDRIYRPRGGGTYLLLRFLTPMTVYLEGEVVVAQQGACLLYTPEYSQDYRAVKEFQNSYVHFLADRRILADMNVPLNEVFYPERLCEIDLCFEGLQEEFLTKDSNSDHMTDALLRRALVLLSRRPERRQLPKTEGDMLYRDFQRARLQMLTQCERSWNIASMCKLVHLEKSQFYTCYVRFYGISPKADLLNARMEKAKNLLSNEALQVQQVAELCGFLSPAHFARQFKKRFGFSPAAFAKQSG